MRWSVALLPALLATACSSYKIPQSHVQAPQASIGAAEQQGAASVPDASARLNVAKRELSAAKQLDKQGDKRSADLMYLRSDADARLASAMAQDSTATADTQRIMQEAQQVQMQIRTLRSQPSAQPNQ